MSKITKCSTCNADVAASAKVCMSCGAKIKKPFYKKMWFILLTVIVIAVAVSNLGGDKENTAKNTSDTTTNDVITYEEYSVSKLIDDLEGNALNAKNTYEGKYVKLRGKLTNIDASGDYISISSVEDKITFYGVQCFIKSDEQKSHVASLNIDDVVTIKGKVISIGEVLGYSINIDEIK